jgi:hypothetical protein
MSKHIDHIFYMNLDYRTDRKEQFEEEMKIMNWETERFSAVYHKPPKGTVGASKSLLSVLKLAKEREYKNVLIFQDDFTFLESKEVVETELQKLFELKPDFDVCMLAYKLNHSVPENDFLIKVLHAQTATALLVNGHYYDTLIELYTESTPKLEMTMQHWLYACDTVWKSLMERDNWYCFNKRLGKQRPSWSDCGNSFVDRGL